MEKSEVVSFFINTFIVFYTKFLFILALILAL